MTQLAVLKAKLFDIECFCFDLDGVLWLGDKMIDKSAETLNYLMEKGKKVLLVTNNSNHTREDIFNHAISRGLKLQSVDQIICSPWLIKHKLIKDNITGKVLVLASDGVLKYLSEIPEVVPMTVTGEESEQSSLTIKVHDDIKALVIGFDATLCYNKLAAAVAIVNNKNCPVYITNNDLNFPTADGLLFPATGSIWEALRVSTPNKKSFESCGKPNIELANVIMELTNLKNYQICFIGDNLFTDIFFGLQANFLTLLVRTGVTKDEDIVKTGIYPHFVIDSIHTMKELMESA